MNSRHWDPRRSQRGNYCRSTRKLLRLRRGIRLSLRRALSSEALGARIARVRCRTRAAPLQLTAVARARGPDLSFGPRVYLQEAEVGKRRLIVARNLHRKRSLAPTLARSCLCAKGA